MIWWISIAVANIGSLALCEVARRSTRARRNLFVVFLACFALLFLSPVIGMVLGLTHAFHGVEGDAVDPSQKARVLAEGISDAMNFAALGICGFLVPSIVALVLFLRAPKMPATPTASSRPLP